MAIRTTADLVKGVLLADYDTVNSPDLGPFIYSASFIVDDLVLIGGQRNPVVSFSTAKQEILERWSGAYFYSLSDKPYASTSVEGASATFLVNKTDPNPYYSGAVNLDTSGILKMLLDRKTATIFWPGGDPPVPGANGVGI